MNLYSNICHMTDRRTVHILDGFELFMFSLKLDIGELSYRHRKTANIWHIVFTISIDHSI